jgi:hypothetical protein
MMGNNIMMKDYKMTKQISSMKGNMKSMMNSYKDMMNHLRDKKKRK